MASGRVSKVKGKVLDTPTVPTIGTATAGAESASVTFTASTKGGPAFTYTAISTPDSITANGTGSPISVTGLTAGTAYTFTVKGNNPTGSSELTSASNSVTPTLVTSYESIATINPGQTGDITFSDIPQTYKHLQIRGTYKDANGNQSNTLSMRFNGASSASYYWHRIGGNGSSAAAANADPANEMFIGKDGGYVGAFVIDILDYTSSTKRQTFKALSGSDTNGSGDVYFTGGFLNSPGPITSITFQTSGYYFTNKTSFGLYGIKG